MLFKLRCFLAHPSRPYSYQGCSKAAFHYGPCEHPPRLMLCRHTGGWYPCAWNPVEVHDPEFCPARDQDPGDEDPGEPR
jgi:hypothetical protein